MNKICYPVFLSLIALLLSSCLIDEDAVRELLKDPDVRELVQAGEKVASHADRTLLHADRLLINANDYMEIAVILFAVYVVLKIISLVQASAIRKQLAAISDSLSDISPTPLESQKE